MFDNSINGERIKQARIYRGLSQAQLADKLNVTKQAISKYETNKMNLNISTIALLPKALGFPLSFFNNHKKINSDNDIVFFRTKDIPKKTQAQLREKINVMENEVIEYFENYIEFPSLNIPDFSDLLLDETCNYNREKIIEVCKRLREYWGIENEPIDNLMYILQVNGFIINKQYIDQNKTDGFSKNLNDKAIIFVSANKESAVRTRFDLAHELGHLVLHRNIEFEELGEKSIEMDADFFASEFLYPRDEFIKEIQNSPLNFELFIRLKEKWKISIQAIIRKCKDFNLISEEKYIYFQKRISYNGWRKKEPLDERIIEEEPRLLKDIIELLNDNNVLSKKTLLREIDLDKEELIKLCNLPIDFFDDTLENLIRIY
ncbi:helix-turn-helix domain-containing protein [Clostridium perfringens]|uniref:helix-turn-helix domain-containing protein n=1 Tax=Clostridium perfringens TaxID=1502 RepID=UPI0018D8BA19|nr:XRE family transcriptional regulator [Clostridium perfringens]ELC8464947.1 ImmA/IrrE family metallo-endopeptidase [Clostridium perfringens]MCR1963669.1 XRE family transcriptional regulator [Clostridium perfringens]QPR51100.1 ImmA/IrrE family metallo-endopeptidase [Clostridium perfringens]